MAGIEILSNKKVRQEIANALDASERVFIVQQGMHAALVATDRRILICKWGVSSGLSPFGRKVNSWALADISDVQFYRDPVRQQSIIIHAPGLAPVTKFGFFGNGPESVWEVPNALFVDGKVDGEGVASALRKLVTDHHGAST